MNVDLGRDGRHRSLVFDVGRALWQDDPEDKLLILQTLGLLGALHEGDLKNVAVSSLELPQEVLEVRIPTDFERVLPASENRVTGLQLKQARVGAIDWAEA